MTYPNSESSVLPAWGDLQDGFEHRPIPASRHLVRHLRPHLRIDPHTLRCHRWWMDSKPFVRSSPA
jgi:inhibitor of KinA sporulation pathway (predicted exonuclease)